MGVGFDDGMVDPTGKAEIVAIDNDVPLLGWTWKVVATHIPIAVKPLIAGDAQGLVELTM
jgi:hypothetical protein